MDDLTLSKTHPNRAHTLNERKPRKNEHNLLLAKDLAI